MQNWHVFSYRKPCAKTLALRPQWFPDRYLPHCVERLIALEAGTLVLSDVGEWWDIPGAFGKVIAAPQDCDRRVGSLLKTGNVDGFVMDYGAAPAGCRWGRVLRFIAACRLVVL